ncbi:hypothetical protein SLEP1_g163 [Rubroshorea leprosula]|uniref:Uncharacterized protein n=1 Tax=Rubroshorea leprosula TaxID=152421 RepID=A0AAV5H9G8_9ROSI|nr:hypothetical protein SLEP1_g163 [Rubroshorea leprosula]
MIHFLCKTVIHGRRTVANSSCVLHITPLLFSSRFISTSSNEQSFTSSYLVKNLGFSPESALSASKHVQFETPDKPDSVVAFFQSQGFSQTQIMKLIEKQPLVLVSDIEKTLLPKLEFFQSKGVSRPEIAKIVSGYPFVLKRSLEENIIPNFDFCSNLLESDEKAIDCMKRDVGVLTIDLDVYILPNINLLKEIGVPDSNIKAVFHQHPRTLVMTPDRFKEAVEKVKNLGFDPLKLNFVQALSGLRGLSTSTWERKIDVYKKYGWSEEDTLQAFQRHPWCMTASENKIIGIMDFLVNIMGINSAAIARRPSILTLSLEKRIIPRGLFMQVLLSKSLIKDFRLSAFEASEKKFLNRYVNTFEENAAELLKIYQEKLDFSSS